MPRQCPSCLMLLCAANPKMARAAPSVPRMTGRESCSYRNLTPRSLERSLEKIILGPGLSRVTPLPVAHGAGQTALAGRGNLPLCGSTGYSSSNYCSHPVTASLLERLIRHKAMLVDPHNLTALMVSIVFFPASPVSPCVSPATYKIQSLQVPPPAADRYRHPLHCTTAHTKKNISPIP